MSEDDFTRPERAAQVCQAKRYRRQIMAGGGCGFCHNRDKEFTYFGKSVCSSNRYRSFPLCMKDKQAPEFELDQSTLRFPDAEK